MTENSVKWHIVTPEYPPTIGGVGDYSQHSANELRRQGEDVSIWYPGVASIPDGYSPKGLRSLDRALGATPGPRRLFVQWVPHGYGYRSMNVHFAWWLWRRARLAGDQVDLMIHEPFLVFGEGTWKQDAAALVHRLMISLALAASSRVWISIPRWAAQIRPWQFGKLAPVQWLPVPNNIEPVDLPPEDLHQRFRNTRAVVGHFGTYGRHILDILRLILPVLQERSGANILLLGKDSDQVAAAFCHPQIQGAGTQDACAISRALAACDIMLQPYTDGVSTRRGSAMAALIHGRPLITTTGPATESIWSESRAVFTVAAGDGDALIDAALDLLGNTERRITLGQRARLLYDEHFSIRKSMSELRQAGGRP